MYGNQKETYMELDKRQFIIVPNVYEVWVI